ncbi:hypothetical protein E0W80_10400 [Microbacterium sp. PI-1]|uniref:hypothetical protein n=1 Tax=Microbacterium sp. PI-1 TaxID=2545631 RepID=UPI00103E4F53|nr:hypothetical protein [Microbacterium sp. PI-1]TCJ23543.1 hypothetical protein E0W80_10400 [Microbacterium sp. PI-1]
MTAETITELSWAKENAEEHVVLLFDPETGEQHCLAILEDGIPVLTDIDKNFALSLAARLVELAIELPESRVILPVTTLPPEERRTVRRLSAVDDHLRALDD